MFLNIRSHQATGRSKWCLAAAFAIICAILLYLWMDRDDRAPPLSNSASQSNAIRINTKLDDHSSAPVNKHIQTELVPRIPLPEKSNNAIELMKAAQAKAARAAIKGKPVAGLVSQRPEFVSEVEWEVLRDVAGHHSEMEKQLTQLVNKLLFYKKREAWMAPTTKAPQRRVLAEELLAMLPAQVDEKAMDPAFAARLERDLRNDLNNITEYHQ